MSPLPIRSSPSPSGLQDRAGWDVTADSFCSAESHQGSASPLPQDACRAGGNGCAAGRQHGPCCSASTDAAWHEPVLGCELLCKGQEQGSGAGRGKGSRDTSSRLCLREMKGLSPGWAPRGGSSLSLAGPQMGEAAPPRVCEVTDKTRQSLHSSSQQGKQAGRNPHECRGQWGRG